MVLFNSVSKPIAVSCGLVTWRIFVFSSDLTVKIELGAASRLETRTKECNYRASDLTYKVMFAY